MRLLKSVAKGAMLLLLLVAAVIDGQMRKWLGWMTPGANGALWVHGWCRRIVRALGIECHWRGPLPEAGFAVVSNHLSYLDALVYSSLRPFVMVSKTEVRGWPLIGWITAQAGTIYVERANVQGGQTQTHAEVNAMMAAAFRSGLPVLFYPEGTTGDGSEVLDFRRGLFHSVLRDKVPLKVAALRYELADRNAGATVARDICYCGDDDFAPHLFAFLGLRGVRVQLQFSAETVLGSDRFVLAAAARECMVEMYERLAAGSGQQLAAAHGGEDLLDRPVDGFGAVYGEGGVRG